LVQGTKRKAKKIFTTRFARVHREHRVVFSFSRSGDTDRAKTLSPSGIVLIILSYLFLSMVLLVSQSFLSFLQYHCREAADGFLWAPSLP
jgi:hypothetical protein